MQYGIRQPTCAHGKPDISWASSENRKAVFVLTGSSARKLRRGHANLLAGRALRYEMGPLCFPEIAGMTLDRVVLSGLIPPHFLSHDPVAELRAYVADYLKEEVAAEAATQNIPAFREFLHVAALTNAELLNYANIAAETGISAKVVKSYFEILDDTLLGSVLRPWARPKRRRLIRTGKFYFFDVGVANYLARRHPVPGSADFGKSFEHYILMELLNYRRYREPEIEVTYWRTASGLEVDFILGDMRAAIECKASTRAHDGDVRGLRALCEEQRVRRRIVVSLEREPRRMEDGIEVYPWREFLELLWSGELAR